MTVRYLTDSRRWRTGTCHRAVAASGTLSGHVDKESEEIVRMEEQFESLAGLLASKDYSTALSLCSDLELIVRLTPYTQIYRFFY